MSLIGNEKLDLTNKSILMFSYGSGLAASMFVLKVQGDLGFIRDKIQIKKRLESRIKLTPEDFDQIMDRRQKLFASNPPYTPEVTF